MTRQANPQDAFNERLVKLIPGEIVMVYLAVRPLLDRITLGNEGEPTDVTNLVSWTVVILMTILTPLYLRRVQGVTQRKQIVVTTASFLVWVYSLGGPFLETFGRNWGPFDEAINVHSPILAAIVLPLWTLAAAIILADPKDPAQ